MKTIKSILKSIFLLVGLDVYLIKTEQEQRQLEHEEFIRTNKWLIDYGFNTIIDIGANEGQFAKKARELFPNANIISFEPIPAVYEKLVENFKTDTHFKAINVGLGEKQEKMKLWLNEYSPSSSILKMDHHTEHFDFAVKQNEIEIQLEQLDSFAQEIDLSKPYLVKLDVQGYEDKVILGGTNLLSSAQMIISEVSFTSLYEGQVLFDRIYTTLKALGFKYAGSYEQLNSPINYEILQADAIFIKQVS